MRNLFLVFSVLSIGLLVIFCSNKKVYFCDGHKWKSLSDEEKIDCVYASMKGAHQTLLRKGKANNDYFSKFVLEEIKINQYVDKLDTFYRDPQNKKIKVSEAVYIVKLELKGASKKFVFQLTRTFRIPNSIYSKGYIPKKRLKEISTLYEGNKEFKEAWDKWSEEIPYRFLY